MNTRETLLKVAELNGEISAIDNLLSAISAHSNNTTDFVNVISKAMEVTGVKASVIELITKTANNQRAALLQQASELLK